MIKISSKFHLIHTEKNFGIRYGSFSFNNKKTFTNQRAKVSTDINYLPDIKKFDNSNLSYPGSILLAYKKLDVEKFIDKDSKYYRDKCNQLKVYSRAGKEDYKVCNPILGIYKRIKVYDKKSEEFKYKKKFFPINLFPDILSKHQTYLNKLLVDMTLDSGYDALINPYKYASFKFKMFLSDIKSSIKRRDELKGINMKEIDIIPNIPLSSKSNKEFEDGVKYIYENPQEFSSADFSYVGRLAGKYNYDSLLDLNKKNEYVMNILSGVIHRKMPDKDFNLSPYHYYPIYQFDLIAKGMPKNFLSEDHSNVHDITQGELRFFEKKSLSIINSNPDLILNRNFNTTFPILNNKDFDEIQGILKRAEKAQMLDILSKAMEVFDSQDEITESQKFVSDDSFKDYLKEKKELNTAYTKHNHKQRRLSDF